jgi:putative transposase
MGRKKELGGIVSVEGSSEFDYSSFESAAIAGLQNGQSLLGADGVLTGLVQRILNAALNGEMSAHLSQSKSDGLSNRRNGHVSKHVQTDLGDVEIQTPRDRLGSFDPQLIPKWCRQLGHGVEQQILSLYAVGMSHSDIQHQLSNQLGLSYSSAYISSVTDSVFEEIVSWQNRPLSNFYVCVFLDGIYFKTREGGQTQSKVLHSVYGVLADGKRELLGIYLRNSESASNWAAILQNMKDRGLEDVLFFCADGLSGMEQAIESIYPNALYQRCIVHMIRTSLAMVSSKDKQEICDDLKTIYKAAGLEEAVLALDVFAKKWDTKYAYIAKKWRNSWEVLTIYLEQGPNIRRMIYTTNSVEALHRHMRSVTKTKGTWVNDKALTKQIYLSLFYGKKTWNRQVIAWNAIALELAEKFGERFTKHFNV